MIQRRAWTCAGCGVSVRNASGKPISFPNGWRLEDGPRCVPCSREQIRIAGGRKGPGNEAVLLYELRRGALISDAAQTANISGPKARGLRKRMVQRGELPPLIKDPRRNGDGNGAGPGQGRGPRPRLQERNAARHRENERRIIEAIEGGATTIKELKVATGLSKRLVTKRLGIAMAEGRVERRQSRGREFRYRAPTGSAS